MPDPEVPTPDARAGTPTGGTAGDVPTEVQAAVAPAGTDVPAGDVPAGDVPAGDAADGTPDAKGDGEVDADAPVDAGDGAVDTDVDTEVEVDEEALAKQRRTRILTAVGGGALIALFIVALLLGGRTSDPTFNATANADPFYDGTVGTGSQPEVSVDDTTPGTAEVPDIPASVDLPPTSQTPTTPTTRKPRKPPTGPAGPLTGAPVDYPGHERNPALVVKIDNDDMAARPQAGLTLADVVYEEKVEGGITRFAAVFQGSDSPLVGPVRSARSTDINIMGALKVPLFAYSGANPTFEALVQQAPIRNVGAGGHSGAYFRAYDRAIPHNLMSSTAALWRIAGSNTPTALWPFRSEKSPLPANSRRTDGVFFSFGGATQVVWRWQDDTKAFQREQNGRIHFDSDNWPVQATNVVIQFVPYVDTGIDDAAGNPVPEAMLVGAGPGWLLSGGYATPIRWEKKDRDSATTFLDARNNQVALLPGKTWVELQPSNMGVSIQWRR